MLCGARVLQSKTSKQSRGKSYKVRGSRAKSRKHFHDMGSFCKGVLRDITMRSGSSVASGIACGLFLPRLFERLETIRLKRQELIRAKLQDKSVL